MTQAELFWGVRMPVALAGWRAILLGALGFITACTATLEDRTAASHKRRPATTDVYESPEFKAHGLRASPAEDRRPPEMSLLTKGFGLFKALVGKPAFRPVSTFHRLFFLSAYTSIDTVKPVSLLWETRSPPLRPGARSAS
jgi:hypothetical protein